MAKAVYYYGYHAALAVIKKRPEDVLQLFVLDNREDKRDKRIETINNAARQFGVSTQAVKKANLEKLANTHQHQGIVIQCRPVTPLHEQDIETLYQQHQLNHASTPALFLVLDQITDPHNLGACMRSAAAMGVTAVISSKKHSCSLTPTAVKVAAGAAELVPYVSAGNLARALTMLKSLGITVIGTMLDDHAISIHHCDFTEASAIVMGAEDVGLRQLTQKTCDQLAYLPMLGDIQSLNVSVATGMALYEARRQVQSLR